MSKNNHTQKEQTKKNRKYLKRTILVILFLSIGISAASALTVNNFLNKINRVNLHDTGNGASNNTYDEEKTDKDLGYDSDSTSDNSGNNAAYKIENTVPRSKDIKNIAIFGIDGTEGEPSRSDCIMIFTIDNIHDKLKLTSIIRDSYVDIPTRKNKDKINHAYAFGGPSLAIETLNNNFDLDISKFASVNFSSFPKIIDELGGITLDISEDELKYINGYINQENSLNGTSSLQLSGTGPQNLDGTQALAYSRIRYTAGGDFERSHRQRIVIEKVFEKLKALPITEYPTILDDLLPLIKTNLSNTEILSIALDVNDLKDNGIIQARFPEDDDADGKMISGIYYYVFDQEVTTDKIKKFIYE